MPQSFAPPNRRQSNESSCCDLYADVERSVHHRKFSPPRTIISVQDQPTIDASPSERSKNAVNSSKPSSKMDLSPTGRNNSSSRDKLGDPRTTAAFHQSFPCRERTTSTTFNRSFSSQPDVPRKPSTSSQSTAATKILDDEFEYEVSPEEASDEPPTSLDRGGTSQNKSFRARTSSKELTLHPRKERTKSSSSMSKEPFQTKQAELTKRSSSKARKSQRDARGRSHASASPSRSKSRSKPRSRSKSRARNSDRELQQSSTSLSKSSSKIRSKSQHQPRRSSQKSTQPKECRRSLSPKRSSSETSQHKSAQSLSLKRTESDTSQQHKDNRSSSPKGGGDGNKSSTNLERQRRESTTSRRSAKMVWSLEDGNMSKSTMTPEIASERLSSASAHPRLGERCPQKEEKRKAERRSSKKEKDDKKDKKGKDDKKDKREKDDKKDRRDKKDKKDKMPLTTRGWRAQMAERFGRTGGPLPPSMSSNTSGFRSNNGRRVPSTLFCAEDFAKSVEDDLTVNA